MLQLSRLGRAALSQATRIQTPAGAFGNKIEKIVEFDPLTGSKTKDLDLIKLYANSHYITPRPTIEQAMIEIKKELEITLKKHKSENKLLEAQRLEERTRIDLEMIEATGTFAGI